MIKKLLILRPYKPKFAFVSLKVYALFKSNLRKRLSSAFHIASLQPTSQAYFAFE